MFKKQESNLYNLRKILAEHSVTFDDEKKLLVEDFFYRMSLRLKNTNTSAERKIVLSELDKYKDLVRLDYTRDSFLAKLFRSKKHPRITFLQKKLDIFKILLEQNSDFQKNFKTQLDKNIFLEKERIQKERKKRRYELSITRDKRALLPQFDDKGNYNLDRLALVHVTRYKPKKSKNGNLCLESLATATDLEHPRNTLHFTINHHVSSHSAGTWNDAQYVIIVPLKEMLQKNGKPLGMSSVDTFFEVGLNEDLELTKGTCIVEPANKKLPEGVFSITQGNRTIYKTKGFTKNERKMLNCSDDMQEADIACNIKLDVMKAVLMKQGYLIDNFDKIDSQAAQTIDKMGKEMDIRSQSGAALHSMIALSGVNRLGYAINLVYSAINTIQSLVNAQQITKKKDECGIEWYEIKQKNKKDIIAGSDIKYYEKQFLEMENLDTYLKDKNETYWLDKSTLKEREVYLVWKQKSQQRIKTLLKTIKNKNLEKIIEEKQSKIGLLAIKRKGY